MLPTVTSGSILVLGGSGLVGSRLVECWQMHDDRYALVAPTHAEIDVLAADALREVLDQIHPDVVVNLAAWADVDGAEPERGDTRGKVYRLNTEYPGVLAHLCAERGAHLIHVSTDYVFDGTSTERPYREEDPPNPLCWYAQTKFRGEQEVAQANPRACIARIEMPFTGRPHPKRDLARTIVARVQSGQSVQGVTDQRITPVFLDDASEALRRLMDARYSGIIHVAASDWITPYAFCRSIAERLGLPLDGVEPASFTVFAGTRPAPRPQHSWLSVSRFARDIGSDILRSIEEELDAWVAQLQGVPSATGYGN